MRGGLAELADADGSKSSDRKVMGVQVPRPLPVLKILDALLQQQPGFTKPTISSARYQSSSAVPSGRPDISQRNAARSRTLRTCVWGVSVSYTHLRAHETGRNLV